MSIRGPVTEYWMRCDTMEAATAILNAIHGRLNANRFDGFPPMALMCVSVQGAKATDGRVDVVFAVKRARVRVRRLPAKQVLGVAEFPLNVKALAPHPRDNLSPGDTTP